MKARKIIYPTKPTYYAWAQSTEMAVSGWTVRYEELTLAMGATRDSYRSRVDKSRGLTLFEVYQAENNELRHKVVPVLHKDEQGMRELFLNTTRQIHQKISTVGVEWEFKQAILDWPEEAKKEWDVRIQMDKDYVGVTWVESRWYTSSNYKFQIDVDTFLWEAS